MKPQTPWAVLICRYTDDANDPATTQISDLWQQWSATNPGWVQPSWQTDTRTILQLYQNMFTQAGVNTNNMPNFFFVNSHEKIDLATTDVYTVILDRTIAEAAALAINPGGTAYQNHTFHLAKKSLQAQYDVDPKDYYAIIVSFQYPDYGAQGGSFDNGPGVFMDIRYVLDNGSTSWGHEMGHAFGLDHSRADAGPDYDPLGCAAASGDYRDPWDDMSAQCVFFDTDPDYSHKGPGFNAWNMRSRGWLDETRVWHCPDQLFSQVLTLRPLHQYPLSGFLAAELPPMKSTSGFPKFLVEYRPNTNWETAFPRSSVQVHRFDGPVGQFLGTHSYQELSVGGNADMVTGDVFWDADGLRAATLAKVLTIDDDAQTATVYLSYLPPFAAVAAGINQDGRIEVFAIAQDDSIHHFWQIAPNRQWSGLFPPLQSGSYATEIAAIQNDGSGTLEAFYIGTNKKLYHNWQTAANGNWHGESEIGNGDTAIHIAIGKNADGRLQLFYRGTNDELYYNAKKASGAWQGEEKLGEKIQLLAVLPDANGLLQVCYIGADGQLHFRSQTHVSASDSWSVPNAFGGPAQGLALGRIATGELICVFIDPDNNLFAVVKPVGNLLWNPPTPLRGTATRIALARNSNGFLDLFFTDAENVIFHLVQTGLNEWGPPSELTGRASSLTAIANADGHLELIYVGTDNNLYHNWQLGSTDTWNGEVAY